MSYRILARKYRPRSFADVIGQDHIVTALSRAIAKNRLGQAYLLVGPRGTGKTSTARILAKAVNCVQGPTGEPCLVCDSCREIESGNNADVIEIDGASNNGVDDVRALRERVHYRPLRDRNKIYIIDEVQRLSGPAFDALLKTLEEPPDHALFLFATTDPHKIPDTIVSRCQVFEFRRLREVDIAAKLADICVREEVEVSGDVLQTIARGCRGGLRDAESMLDQVLAVAEGAPTLDDLEMIAGLARPERWLDLYEAVAVDDAAGVLHCIDAFLQRGGTERDFVQQGADALRDLLHLVLLGEDALGVEPSPERRERSMNLARRLGRDRLESMLGMLFALEGRMARAPLAARALLEWTILRAARLGELLDTAHVLRGMREGESPPAPVAARLQPAPSAKAGPAGGKAPIPAPALSISPAATAAPEASRGRESEPLGARAFPSLESLLEQVRVGRASLGRAIDELYQHGEMRADEVYLLLRMPDERARVILEDPVSRKWLERLPDCPGPWTIEFEQPVERKDLVGDALRQHFDAVEELP
ncbi:MAG: DNA polymerase III subunit gamma/tau [Planctomycetes bacterium]|nr:DNA polymerase III subunit gamma/tau [Planctomycetota bacterium]